MSRFQLISWPPVVSRRIANRRGRILTQPANLKSATDLLDDLSSALRGCPSDYYVLASQPGVHSTDFSKRNAAPRLGAKMTGKDRDIRSKMIVSEVVGAFEAKQIQDLLEKECGAQTTVVDGSCKCLFAGGARQS